MPTLEKAFEMAEPDFSNHLKQLKPDSVINDIIQPWVPETALQHNIPAVEFVSTGADFPLPEIYVHDYEKSQIAHLMESALDPEKDKDQLEGKYFDYLSVSDLLEKKIVPVGSLVEDIVVEDHQEINTNTGSTLDWLNQRDKYSTVFVCLGSELFLSKEGMEEVAIGLEPSDVNFIWVVRLPKGEEIRVEEVLPEGFLERVGENGMVV
nr:beta-D-glucosyl crocetin beta-1,6-glucosyltransferase-like [Coffea arabica]